MIILADGLVVDGIYVFALLAGAGSVIALLFKLLIASKERETTLVVAQKDKALADLESQRKSYAEVATEALKSAMDTANFYRQRDGKAPIIPLPAVISESHSPSTAEQRDTAALATMRATMAQIKVVTGQEPRPEQPHAIEPADSVAPKPAEPSPAEKSTTVDTVQQGMIAVLKHSISEVPERTAVKVMEKIEEEKHATE